MYTNIHEDCELSGNTAENSSAKSIPSETRIIPVRYTHSNGVFGKAPRK
ncbi:hypothetical protein RVIR1_09990 [Candidatus Rickettsiella viridis]|uniref:Uncharacterized protein n=1 Tax=Candidatus Rickettsiella viridis TaxID=676208 RepID=A0A2Z5V4W4_9COXI|nr:hypothetical protein RVIR1_09990 [Candidatus Rickettsiella viridis]